MFLTFERKFNEVKRLVLLIEATEYQSENILEKAEDILKKLILRAKRGKITIPKNSNPLTHAAAIIYAVIVSNENMPILSGRGLAKFIEANPKAVNELYNKWYKDLAPKLDFNFQSAQLRNSRRIISLYIFELLLDAKTDISELILHLRKRDTYRIVLRLGEIITNTNKEISKRLTLKEKNLLKQLTTREVETLQDMVDNYSDTFTKYFTDLVDIIKLLIISNKSHKIIGAVFSIAPFVKYLINKKINLFLTQRGLLDVIGDIFNFLKETEYSELFPARTQSKEDELYQIDETGKKRQLIASVRIKIYVMKHIDGGNHFDLRNGVVLCPDCLNEGFIVNISLPRIRSKEFHHEDSRLKGYTAIDLYNLFNENRGDPYFLQNLIKQMERESVVIKCGCHHNVIHDDYPHFNKFVNWKNIPKEFPYKDIFDLPAEIIHILAYICVEAFYQGKKSKRDMKEIKNRLVYKIKKRYIIDLIYRGVCPVCGEFNIIDHSRAIDYNHLYRLIDLTPEEREKRKKNRLIDLYKKLSCSELVREMQEKYHKGGYVCHNCHTVIHTDLELIAKIYDDPNILKKIREDKEDALRKYKQNLIRITKLIKNPLKSEIVKYKAFMKYLFAIFKIMEEKDEVSIVDLANEMGKEDVSTIRSFFRRRKKRLEKYGIIVFGDSNNPTRFYMSEEGKRIVHLLFFFKSYYENLSLSDEEELFF